MKTRNNQILIALFFSFLIFAGSVSAKGTELEKASSLEIVVENSLEIENWMLEANYWSTSTEFAITPVIEEALQIEPWMLEDEFTSEKESLNINSLPANEEEQELKIESWMINANYWNIN